MDLVEYEKAKFELAAILRAAAAARRAVQPMGGNPFSDLFARLAEDRFNLVVVGRFSRGKSSRMNAMLASERLPTGIVPLTSVITTVSYGSSERAFIEHEGWSLAKEIRLAELPDYVTQQGNPGNRRRVTLARVELTAELLRRGFHFVDTPGLGSSVIENTRTTERFLPHADAFMLVTSYDSPLSEEELRVIHGIAALAARVFIVVNKHDIVTPDERIEVLGHVAAQALQVFGDPPPRIFSVSARDAAAARQRHDAAAAAASGVPELRDALTRFLLDEKSREFLLRVCARVTEAIHGIAGIAGEAERLHALQAAIAESGGRPGAPQGEARAGRRQPASALSAAGERPAAFTACTICERVSREMYDFLCRYQYDITVDRSLQATLAERGGLCPSHLWQYEALASPHGICVAFSGVLEDLARRLRRMPPLAPVAAGAAIAKLRATPESCDLCRAKAGFERAAIAAAARTWETAARCQAPPDGGMCLPHLEQVIAVLGSAAAQATIIAHAARMIERLSEDMRRYALKHDGMKRTLTSDEEVAAAKNAVSILARRSDR